MQTITSESELLQASLAGSTEAFGQIVERYQPLICAITYSATGDSSISQELAQETFLRAWKSLSQLRELDRFRVWLCRIARNVISRSIRKKRFDVINEPQLLEEARPIQSTEADPYGLAAEREQQSVVWRAIEAIPEIYREPMVLYYRREQSVSEVASDLGLTEGAVRQRLKRGRGLLRSEVATLVEDVLGRTGPKRAFTVAVLAALPALAPPTAAAGVAAVAAKGSAGAKVAVGAGLAGAIFGPLLGLFGGLFGSWMSIKNTRSPRERRFMAKMTLVIWVEMALIFIVLGCLGLLAFRGIVPRAVFWTASAVLMTSHFVMLAPAIIWANRRQRKIQKEDGTFIEPSYRPIIMTRGNILGSLAGGIFGPAAWVIPVWFIAGDWLAAVIVVVVATVIFQVSTHICLADKRKYRAVIVVDVIALLILDMAVVNLRWSLWTPHFARSSSSAYMANIPLWVVNLAFLAVFGVVLLMLGLMWRRESRLPEDTTGE